MLISEQKYTNLNRIYYHGKIKGRKENLEEFYLTTRFAYAFIYSTGYMYGEVEEYKLRKTANIFNAKCIPDESALRKFCQKNAPNILKYIELLKENDWMKIRDPALRQDLIVIIKSLKYDGYFNFEIDKKALRDLHDEGIYSYDNFKHSPSVGIFNINSLEKLQVWNKNNFEQNKAFTEFHNLEISEVKEDILFEKSKTVDAKEIYNKVKVKYSSLTYTEIMDLIENTTLEESLIYRKNLLLYVEELKNRIHFEK